MRALGVLAVGAGLLVAGLVVVPWLLYRDVQWRNRQRFMGRYAQPVEPWADEGIHLAESAEAGARAA